MMSLWFLFTEDHLAKYVNRRYFSFNTQYFHPAFHILERISSNLFCCVVFCLWELGFMYVCVLVCLPTLWIPRGTSLAVQWLRLHASSAGNIGSILCQETMIPYAPQYSLVRKKKLFRGITKWHLFDITFAWDIIELSIFKLKVFVFSCKFRKSQFVYFYTVVCSHAEASIYSALVGPSDFCLFSLIIFLTFPVFRENFLFIFCHLWALIMESTNAIVIFNWLDLFFNFISFLYKISFSWEQLVSMQFVKTYLLINACWEHEEYL